MEITNFQVVISLPILLSVIAACGQLVTGDEISREDTHINALYRYRRNNNSQPAPEIIKAARQEVQSSRGNAARITSSEERMFLQTNKMFKPSNVKLEPTSKQITNNLPVAKNPYQTTNHTVTSVTQPNEIDDDYTTTEGDRIGTKVLESLGGPG